MALTFVPAPVYDVQLTVTLSLLLETGSEPVWFLQVCPGRDFLGPFICIHCYHQLGGLEGLIWLQSYSRTQFQVAWMTF